MKVFEITEIDSSEFELKLVEKALLKAGLPAKFRKGMTSASDKVEVKLKSGAIFSIYSSKTADEKSFAKRIWVVTAFAVKSGEGGITNKYFEKPSEVIEYIKTEVINHEGV